MKTKIYLLGLMFMLAFGGLATFRPTVARAQDLEFNIISATVKDPTGTALNVRSTPNGKKVVAVLKNGTKVLILKEKTDGQNRLWSYIRLDRKNSKPMGWVLGEYLASGIEENEQ